jgi:hypothetical protein
MIASGEIPACARRVMNQRRLLWLEAASKPAWT